MRGAPVSVARSGLVYVIHDPEAACSLRFALAPGYLLVAPPALVLVSTHDMLLCRSLWR